MVLITLTFLSPKNRTKQEKLHQSAGISIMPVMNRNFVVAVDIGKSFNAQDGNIGFAIGLNYLF
jgi:hypothetical protein